MFDLKKKPNFNEKLIYLLFSLVTILFNEKKQLAFLYMKKTKN